MDTNKEKLLNYIDRMDVIAKQLTFLGRPSISHDLRELAKKMREELSE